MTPLTGESSRSFGVVVLLYWDSLETPHCHNNYGQFVFGYLYGFEIKG